MLKIASLVKTLSLLSLISSIYASLSLQKAEVNILDKAAGSCTIKINPTKPKSIDYDVHADIDAKDIILQFGAFSMIDGKYNEIIESEKVSICNLSKSPNPLVAFVFKEMEKAGNLTTACPIKKGYYYLHGFTLYESDVPIPLPNGNFMLEVNGTLHSEDDKMIPLFESSIYFAEAHTE